jgi:multiple sugar transport system permease protein
MYVNSVAITLPIVFGQVIVASFAAYSFVKMKFPLRDALFFIYIVVMLMPYQVTLVPNYLIMDKLGWIGSYKSVIFPGIFNTFGVFLLRQYIHMIPDGYIEAAKIDGAGPLRIFISVILPQCKSALASLIILTFIDNWNMVEQPIIMLGDEKKYPFSILLAYISEKDFTMAFACGVIYMIPVICFAIFFHNYLIKGIQMYGMR